MDMSYSQILLRPYGPIELKLTSKNCRCFFMFMKSVKFRMTL